MLASFPLSTIVDGVSGDQHWPSLVQVHKQRHVAGRVTRRLDQKDRSVPERVQLALDELPPYLGAIVILADVSGSNRGIRRARGLELARVHHTHGTGEVSQRAGVIDVEVRLYDVADRVRADAK